MKLITKIVGATLGLALAVGVGAGLASSRQVRPVYASDVTNSVTLSSGVFSTDHITWTLDDVITITQRKGTSSTNVNSSYISAPRIYKGHYLSFEAATNYYLKSISITYDGSYYGNSMTAGTALSSNTVTDNTTSVSRTWANTNGGTHVVGSVSDAGLSAIYIQNVASGSNVQLRPTAISITYSSPSGGGATQLGTPAPEYADGNITWEAIENASSYTISINGADPVPATSPYSTSSFAVPGAYAVTVKAIGDGENYLDSAPGSVTFALLNKAGTDVDPYDVANARAAIDGNADVSDVYVTGIVSKIVTPFNSQYGNITYNISSDGLTTSNQFQAYRGKSFSGNPFTSEEDISVGATVVVLGSIKKYNTTYEFEENSQLVEYTAPAAKKVINSTKHTSASLAYHYSKVGDTYSDELTRTFTGISGTSYTAWSDKTGTSGAVYAGNSAGPASGTGGNSIQLRSNNNSGIITTSSSNKATKVTIVWNGSTANGRTVDVYGDNTAYTATSELYGSPKGTKLGSIVKGTSTELEIDGSYKYIGLRSNDGALYLTSVTIDWEDSLFEYSDVKVRFSGMISSTLWSALDSESDIKGYGFMISYSDLGGASIESKYNSCKTELNTIDDAIADTFALISGKNLYKPISKGAHPDEANSAQKGSAPGTQYIWSLYKTVLENETGLDEQQVKNKLNDAFSAVAYIRVADELVFFQESDLSSAAGLAKDIIDRGDGDSNTADGSLSNLAGLLA